MFKFKPLITTLSLVYISLLFYESQGTGSTEEDEFNWTELIDWNAVSSSPKTEKSPLNNSNLKKRKRSKESIEKNKVKFKKYYHENIKRDPIKLEKLQNSRKQSYEKSKLSKLNHLNSLSESERNVEVVKKKKIRHLEYLKRKEKDGNKTKLRIPLDRIKENQATEEDHKELAEERNRTRIKARRYRQKKYEKTMLAKIDVMDKSS